MSRKLIAVLFVVLFLTISTYFLSPFVGAIVWSLRLRQYVKVKMEYPCSADEQATRRRECNCEFVFANVKSPNVLSFDDTLHRIFDPRTRTFSISGTGAIRSRSNTVFVAADHVTINETELRPQTSSCHVLIKPDGTLENSRIDIAW